jgi:DNA-binding XRE family transcriptional regulator
VDFEMSFGRVGADRLDAALSYTPAMSIVRMGREKRGPLVDARRAGHGVALSPIAVFMLIGTVIEDLTRGGPCWKMYAIEVLKDFAAAIADLMKYDETPLLAMTRLAEAHNLGQRLTELRQAYRLRQIDVAAKAGLSRSTAVLIEKGDPGRTLGQLLRYLHAIEPNVTLQALVEGNVAAVSSMNARNRTQRVRPLSDKQLKAIDF